jgi:hypothetical protein
MEDLSIHPLGYKEKKVILSKWPELDDLEEVNENVAWQNLSFLRGQAIDSKIKPSKDDIPEFKKFGAWLMWFSGLSERCAYKEMDNLSPALIDLYFKSSLQMIRNEWLLGIETFVPAKYRAFLDDKEGWVSAVEDPFELLWLSLPNHHMDDNLWQYRRWLARRDWFMGNLGTIVSHYRGSLRYFDIGEDFDKYFKPPKKGFELFPLEENKKLPMRELCFGNKTAPIYIHTDWNKKGMPSLLFKILRKDYSYNGGSIFTDVYDVLRALFVVEEKYLDFLLEFISIKYPDLKRKDRKNSNTSLDFNVISLSGMILGQKFELHVQLLRDYKRAQEVGETNHFFYKAKQFYQLLNLMLPVELIQRQFGGFDYTSEEFRCDYQSHVLASI